LLKDSRLAGVSPRERCLAALRFERDGEKYASRELMAQEYRPGEIVPQSGVYAITHDPVHADMPHEVTVDQRVGAFRRVATAGG
jgi:hypothetical protein